MKHPHALANPWPWPVKPLYWLYFLFDWLDNQDRPDHGKVQVDAVMWTALWLHYYGAPLSIGQLVVFFSAAFGARVWLAFLKSRTVTAHEEIAVSKVIIERRGNGEFEATP